MDEQEFLSLDYVSRMAGDLIEHRGKRYLCITLWLTSPGRKANPILAKEIRFLLDRTQANQLARGLSNGIEGVSTIY